MFFAKILISAVLGVDLTDTIDVHPRKEEGEGCCKWRCYKVEPVVLRKAVSGVVRDEWNDVN